MHKYVYLLFFKHCPIVNTAPFHDGGRGSFSLLLSPLLAAYFCISAKFVGRLFFIICYNGTHVIYTVLDQYI
jgi:hypothetical protein